MDYNATAPVREEAQRALAEALAAAYGNPSSTHFAGREAKRALDDARVTLAGLCDVEPRHVVFTSGGTESDNLAIKGIAAAAGSGHIVTTTVEHPAVLEPCRYLERNGFDVTVVPVDGGGRVTADDVAAAIRDDTILVTVMWVNNETGVVQPVDEIGAAARARGVPFHSDAVQAFGRVPVNLSQTPVDMISISGHKFGAPKGVGALLLARDIDLEPVSHGGGQERNRRSGTHNAPGASALAVAARLAVDEMDAEAKRLSALRDRLEAGILDRIPDAVINGAGVSRVANTANVRLDGADGEAVLLALDGADIAASSASACAASHDEPSYVLTAMGLTRRQAEDSMRFSLGRLSTDADVDALLDALPPIVERLRALPRT